MVCPQSDSSTPYSQWHRKRLKKILKKPNQVLQKGCHILHLGWTGDTRHASSYAGYAGYTGYTGYAAYVDIYASGSGITRQPRHFRLSQRLRDREWHGSIGRPSENSRRPRMSRCFCRALDLQPPVNPISTPPSPVSVSGWHCWFFLISPLTPSNQFSSLEAKVPGCRSRILLRSVSRRRLRLLDIPFWLIPI